MSNFTRFAALAALLAVWCAKTAPAQVLRETHYGSVGFELFGLRAAALGDVDGDGVSDYGVGATGYSTSSLTDCGRVVVYSGATGAMLREHVGAVSNDHLGRGLCGAGDVNGDGLVDYVIGIPGHDGRASNIGRASCLSGLDGSELWSVVGVAAQGDLGYAVAGIGDVDGDGAGDVLIGTLNDEIFLVDAAGNTIYNIVDSSGLGAGVSDCGDLTGDGIPGFLVGKPFADKLSPFTQDVGAVVAYSGATGALIRTYLGSDADEHFGWTIARVGDVDGDAIEDFVAGAMSSSVNATFCGRVLVWSGSSNAILHEVAGTTDFEEFGASVAGVGDVNLDGIPDFAAAAIGAGAGHEGAARICSGADAATIHEWFGVNGSNEALGGSLASADWNGDGVDDLLIGDHAFVQNGTVVGSADVYLMCPAWFKSYGSGWPGRNGIPRLTAQQDPEVGGPINVDLGNSLGASTAALLFVGLDDAGIPTNAGGTLVVLPLFSILLALPAGGITLSDRFPDDPALYFLDIYLQAIEADSFATKGLSFTAGLQLHLGFDLS
jgi:hypothetical protein